MTTLTPEDVKAVAAEIVAQLRAQPLALVPAPAVTPDVLTKAEAMAYVKRRSDRAFYDWCKRFGLRSHHGRYSRARLDVALDREARRAA